MHHLPDLGTEKEAVEQDLVEQILYSEQELVKHLQTYLCYSANEAHAIAWRTVIQGTLFSFGSSIFSDGAAALLPPQPQEHTLTEPELTTYRQQRRAVHHALLLPVFSLYLYDNEIDHPTTSENKIAQLVNRTGVALKDNTMLYYQKLMQILNIVWESETSFSSLLEDSDFLPYLDKNDVSAFSLLVPFLEQLKKAGVDKQEVQDLLHSFGDALTNGHLAVVWWPEVMALAQAFNENDGQGSSEQRMVIMPTDILDALFTGQEEKVLNIE
jgi:hypothetical protein